MRADARKNYDHIVKTAVAVVAEQGAAASLRDIARRANIGLGTLYRHFPTRDALLEALLHDALATLTQQAEQLGHDRPADEALLLWLAAAVEFVRCYRGVVDIFASALDDSGSALHVSCQRLREAGARLLHSAQTTGSARDDVDGTDLFGIIGALGWIGEQPAFTRRADHLTTLIAGALLTSRPDA